MRRVGTAILRFSALAALLIATVCRADEAATRVNKGAAPTIGIEAEVGTGEVIYAEFNRYEVAYARLKSAVKVSDSGMTLPMGRLLEAADDSTAKKPIFCGWEGAAHYCLIDTDADRIFDKAEISLGGRPLPRISGAYAMEYQAAEGASGWRKEIVYQGASAGVARFTFRDFGADWTTPRESREVSYDLAVEGATAILYQGASIEILSATSNGVRYKVKSGFHPAR